jgi:hypothetical protein
MATTLTFCTQLPEVTETQTLQDSRAHKGPVLPEHIGLLLINEAKAPVNAGIVISVGELPGQRGRTACHIPPAHEWLSAIKSSRKALLDTAKDGTWLTEIYELAQCPDDRPAAWYSAHMQDLPQDSSVFCKGRAPC